LRQGKVEVDEVWRRCRNKGAGGERSWGRGEKGVVFTVWAGEGRRDGDSRGISTRVGGDEARRGGSAGGESGGMWGER